MSNKDDKEENFGFSDAEFEIKSLKGKILDLESKNKRMKDVIIENDLVEEIKGLDSMSDSERICVKGIAQILELVEKGTQDDSDIKNFDILYKNLRLIRGQEISSNKGRKAKAANVKDLIKIVKDR